MNTMLEKHTKAVAVSLGTIAAITILIDVIIKKSKDNNKVPLVPFTWPFLGSTLLFYKDQKDFSKTATLTYGEAFRLHLHGSITTVVGSQDVTEVFKNQNLSFTTSNLKFVGPNFLYPRKKYVLPSAAIFDTIKKHLIPNIDVYGVRAYKKMREVAEMNIKEMYVADNLLPFVKDLVSRSSATALLGTSLAQREDLIHTFKNCVDEISKEQKPSLARLIFPFINSIYIRLFRPRSSSIDKHKKTIKEAILSEIDRRMKSDGSENKAEEIYLIDHILETYPGEINDDYLESVTFVIIILIFVGIDTTTNAVNYVLYQLMLHKEYIEELRQEQEEIFSENPDQEFVGVIGKKMVKLDSFIREALRYRSGSLGLAHTNISEENVYLNSGAVIRPGEEVYLNLWQIHHTTKKDDTYSENLDTFQAFRYLETDRVATQTGQDYLAFGLGRHACPGRWFAVHQIKGILSILLRYYDITPVDTIQPPKGFQGFTGFVRFTKRV